MSLQENLSKYRNTYRGIFALLIGTLLLSSAFYAPIMSGFLLTNADGNVSTNTIVMGSIGCLFFFGGIQQVTVSIKNYAKKKLDKGN